MGHNKKIAVSILVAFTGIIAVSSLIVLAGQGHGEYAVSNAKDAISIAQAAFVETYGEDELEEPLVAQYQERNATWLVSGTLPEAPEGMVTVGGVPHALISAKDGEVIQIWHDK